MSRRIDWYESVGRDDDEDDEGESSAPPPPSRRPGKLEVLVDGPAFSVVAKPSGMPTIPQRFATEVPTAVEALHAIWRRTDPEAPSPVVCHRLDRDASGCLVLARDRATAKAIMTQFRKRQVEKRYVALALGAPHPPSGSVEFRVAPDRRRPGAMILVRKGGKACEADYETVESFRGVTLVAVTARGGRTHHVRLALAHLGTPCAVDPLYGSAEPLLLSRWKRDYRTGRGRAERPLIDRLTLHAEKLAFVAPGGDPDDPSAWVRAEAPLPRDFAATLRQLRRHAAPGTL